MIIFVSGGLNMMSTTVRIVSCAEMCLEKLCPIHSKGSSPTRFPWQEAGSDPAPRVGLDAGPPEREILQNEVTDPTVSQGLNDFESVINKAKKQHPASP